MGVPYLFNCMGGKKSQNVVYYMHKQSMHHTIISFNIDFRGCASEPQTKPPSDTHPRCIDEVDQHVQESNNTPPYSHWGKQIQHLANHT